MINPQIVRVAKVMRTWPSMVSGFEGVDRAMKKMNAHSVSLLFIERRDVNHEAGVVVQDT